jgi:hypothetical protein
MIKVKHGEVWHLYQILNSVKSKPRTQFYLRAKSKIHHQKLDFYLKKLKSLGYISEMPRGRYNRKLWESTVTGKEFKNTIEHYVKLRID